MERKRQTERHMPMGLSYVIAGLCFLFLPTVNVIDLLPDAIGWLLVAIGMHRLAYVREELYRVRRLALLCALVGGASLVPMYWSCMGAERYPLAAEPTMVLTYALVFNCAQLFLGRQVLFTLIDGLSGFGLMGDCKCAYRRTGRLKFLTGLFLLLKTAGSIAPELVYLRSTRYLENVVYGVVLDIRDYRPLLIGLCAFVVTVVGVIWFIRFTVYLARIMRDRAFADAVAAYETERSAEVRGARDSDRIRAVFAFFCGGGVFFCHMSMENVDILPNFVGILLITVAVFLLKRYVAIPGPFICLSAVIGCLSAAYYGYAVWHSTENHGFWTGNMVQYITGKGLAVSTEKQMATMRLQLIALGIAVLMVILWILYFKKLLAFLHSLNDITVGDGVTLYDAMSARTMRSEREAYARMPRFCFSWFCVSASMEAIQNLPVFAFVITPVTFVRVVVDIVFLWRFYVYLTALKENLIYHFRYNGDTTAK